MSEDNGNREVNEVVEAINKLGDRINVWTDTRTPATIAAIDLDATPYATSVRMRTAQLMLSPSAAATITLTIGTKSYAFTFAANAIAPTVLPFVQIVDRGVDISIAASAGSVTAYLLYTPE